MKKNKKKKSLLALLAKIIKNKYNNLIDYIKYVFIKVFDYIYLRCKYIKNNKEFKGFTFRSEIKNYKVGIFNPNKELIKVLNNARQISKSYSIPKTTVYRKRYII